MCYIPVQLQLSFVAYNEAKFYLPHIQSRFEDIRTLVKKMPQLPHTPDSTLSCLDWVNLNNVTYNAFAYNPSRVHAFGAPFDHAFITDPFGAGFTVNTELDELN
ncbi:hypothetical protein BX070DRAFT_231957 [Coemansia spiralis]|nr:hypothetical protein BX070DRAFT_231957 [Coemansia spiralis]